MATTTESAHRRFDHTNGYQPLPSSEPRSVPPLNPNGPPTFTKVEEQNRTYTFPNGKVTLQGIVDINVSKSGTHRINTKDGKKHIVPPGWIHIEFDADNWTF